MFTYQDHIQNISRHLRVCMMVWWPSYKINPPATTIDSQTNPAHGSNLVQNSDGDSMILNPQQTQNFMETTTPAVPEIDFSQMNITNDLVDKSLTVTSTDIKDFLARPILCPATQTTWTTALTRGTVLMRMSVPDTLLADTMFSAKLSGYYGFKANLVLKFQTNAQKFQQGMALICFIPLGSTLGGYRESAINTIYQYSQLPSVRHDISTTNETIIRVPFISPFNAYSVTSFNQAATGTVLFVVYSPVTMNTINYRCWCHFEDVELFYPSAQSGNSGGKKVRSIIQSDKEDSGGILSQPIRAISSGISMLGHNIPMLSSYTGPTSWFLDVAARGLAAFGFSGGVDTSTRHSVVPRITSHMNNIDVDDTVESVGYTAGNKVALLNGFAGSAVDEMSFAYLFSIPSFKQAFTVTTSTAVGTLLANIPQRPKSQETIFTSSSGPFTMHWTAPYAYVANAFNQWRGSIVLKIYCVKTNFHNARLELVFSPNGDPTKNTFNLAKYHTRYIWDISQTPYYEVTMPFINTAPWVRTAVTQADNTRWNAGTLSIFLLTELEVVDNASTSIEFIIEEYAGPDFEVAVPRAANWEDTPVFAFAPNESANTNYKKYKNLYISGKLDPEVKELNKIKSKAKRFDSKKKNKQKQITNNRTIKYDVFAQAPNEPMLGGRVSDGTGFVLYDNKKDLSGLTSMYTTGECLRSVKQIIMRSNILKVDNNTIAQPSTYVTLTGESFFYDWYNLTANVLRPNEFIMDGLSYFGALYGLYRGSTVLRAIPDSIHPVRMKCVVVQIAPTTQDPTNSPPWPGYADMPSNNIVSRTDVQGALDVHIPFFSLTHSKVVDHHPYSLAAVSNISAPSANQRTTVLLTATSQTSTEMPQKVTMDIYRQAGDDFHFGCFLGVLPLRTNGLGSSPIIN